MQNSLPTQAVSKPVQPAKAATKTIKTERPFGLVQVTWTVVAGPPNSPKTITTFEDPNRFDKLGIKNNG